VQAEASLAGGGASIVSGTEPAVPSKTWRGTSDLTVAVLSGDSRRRSFSPEHRQLGGLMLARQVEGRRGEVSAAAAAGEEGGTSSVHQGEQQRPSAALHGDNATYTQTQRGERVAAPSNLL
jgi:hypothetical protein